MTNISIRIFTKDDIKNEEKWKKNVDTLDQALYVDVEEIEFVYVFFLPDPNLLGYFQEDDHYVQVTNDYLAMPMFVPMCPLRH
jgi:hypothetical protein